MQQAFSLSANSRATNRRQAYVLLLLGVVFLIVAGLGLLNSYPVGPRDAQRVYPIEPFHSERHPPMEPGEQGTDEAIGAKERSMDASELAKRNGLGKIRQKRKIGNQATGLRGKSNA